MRRKLYRGAAAVVCPSIAEGFDLSGIEAIRRIRKSDHDTLEHPPGHEHGCEREQADGQRKGDVVGTPEPSFRQQESRDARQAEQARVPRPSPRHHGEEHRNGA